MWHRVYLLDGFLPPPPPPPPPPPLPPLPPPPPPPPPPSPSSSPSSSPFTCQDLGKGKVCPKTGVVCSKKSPCRRQHSAEQAGASPRMWFRPTSLDVLFEIVGNQANQPFKLLVADTGKGELRSKGSLCQSN